MTKIKQFIESDGGKDVLTVFIVILVGLSSFGLGRLSKGNPGAGIRIEYPTEIGGQEANVVSSVESSSFLQNTKTTSSASSTKTFFASSRGSKYYSASCSGGKTIKQENRVYFSTSAEAEKAGYELSASCK